MYHSTTIEVTRTGAGCGLTVWCNSKLITGYVVQRSACLSELDIGSTDIPIPPAAFWDWVEYSPSDNASKGVLELCCLLEAACTLRDPDTAAATTAALARLYRAELRKDTFDATSSHPPPFTDLQQPLHTHPGPQLSRFNATTSHLPPAAWSAIAANLHLWETLPGPLPLLSTTLSHHLSQGHLDLCASFPSSHNGAPAANITASLAPVLACCSSPCISAVTAALPADAPVEALGTLAPHLAHVSEVTLHVDAAATAPDGHLYRFLAALPRTQLLTLRIVRLRAAPEAASLCTHADTPSEEGSARGAPTHEDACISSPDGHRQPPKSEAGPNKVAEVACAAPSPGPPATTHFQKLASSAAPRTPLRRLRSCLDCVAGRRSGAKEEVLQEPQQSTAEHSGAEPTPSMSTMPPPPPPADNLPPGRPQDGVLRTLWAVQPKLAGVRSLSVPVSIGCHGDAAALKMLPVSHLSLLHLSVHVRSPRFQAAACRALAEALARPLTLGDLAIQVNLQADPLQILAASVGTLTTLRSLALRGHRDGEAHAWPPIALRVLSTLSALERLACPPCLPLLPCMPQLTYLEWTGPGVEVPRDARFTIPTLREFVLPCALPMHGAHGSLQSVLESHPRLHTIRSEPDGVAPHPVPSSSDTPAVECSPCSHLCCCQGSEAGATGHMVDSSAWGTCMLRDDCTAADLISAVGADSSEVSPDNADPDDSGLVVPMPGCLDPLCPCRRIAARRIAARTRACATGASDEEPPPQHGRASALLPQGSSIHASLTSFGVAMPWIEELRLQVDADCHNPGVEEALPPCEDGIELACANLDGGQGDSDQEDEEVCMPLPRVAQLLWRAGPGFPRSGGGARLGLTALQRLDLRGVRGVLHCLEQLRDAALPALSALRLSGRQHDASALLKTAAACEGWPALRELRLGVCVQHGTSCTLRKLKLHWGAEGGRDGGPRGGGTGGGGGEGGPRRMRRLERRVLQEVALRCLHVEHASVSICRCVVQGEGKRPVVDDGVGLSNFRFQD